LSNFGSLIPENITGEERYEYISTQRDRLRTLLQAFDNEAGAESSTSRAATHASGASLGSATGDLKKSRSESEFEDLANEEVPKFEKRPDMGGQRRSSWSKWVWGNYGEKDSALVGKKEQ